MPNPTVICLNDFVERVRLRPRYHAASKFTGESAFVGTLPKQQPAVRGIRYNTYMAKPPKRDAASKQVDDDTTPSVTAETDDITSFGIVNL
jgi:hypothetical protein